MYVIKTDNKWHNFLYGYQLPRKQRKEFDYMNDGDFDSGSFIKYRNSYYSLNDFMRTPSDLKKLGWDGFYSDTYFSGVVIKISSDGEQYKIGHVYAKED